MFWWADRHSRSTFSLIPSERSSRSPRILFIISHIPILRLLCYCYCYYPVSLFVSLLPQFSPMFISSSHVLAHLVSFHTYSSARFASTITHVSVLTPSQFALPTNYSSFIPPFSPPTHSLHDTVLSLSCTHVLSHFFTPPVSPPLLNPTYNTYSTGIRVPVKNTNI